jgi:uncharacterized RDD family membrane protein YckC
MSYSGFWLRVAALLIDFLIMLPVYAVFAILEKQPDLFWIAFLGSVVTGWLYFALFESGGWQGTPGKRLMKIRVTGISGERISFLRATARHFAKTLSSIILGIGYLMAAFTQKKQALHDMICETLVLRGRSDSEQFNNSEERYGFAEPNYEQSTLVINKPENTFSISSSGNWVFAGFDSSGQVIRLLFSDSDNKLNTVGLILGRESSAADLHIADNSISRKHARLYKSGGSLFIEDLGSTNGLFVGGKPISQHQSAELRPHDSLVIGGIEFSIGRS